MKIFVSGKIGEDVAIQAAGFMAELKRRGHTITFDWTTIEHLRPYEQNRDASAQAALLEVQGVAEADALVLLSHERGVGMFVELGVALALAKPVVVLARPPARTMFFFHPLVQVVETPEEVFAALEVLGDRPAGD